MGLWLQAQIIFRNKAPQLLSFNCFVEFVIVVALLIVSVLSKCDPPTITEIYRWLAISLAFISQIYFAYKAIRKGNLVQLKAFLILSIITTLCIYIKFATISAQCPERAIEYIEWVVIGLTVIVAINQFFFILSYRIAKDRFIERMMRDIPAIDEEIESYELWNGLKAMISINFLFQTLVLLGYLTFYDYEQEREYNRIYWYILDAIIYLAFIIFSRIGYVAVMSRRKVNKLNGYLGFIVFLQVYEIVRLAFMILFATKDISLSGYKYSVIVSQIVVTVFGMIIQAYTYTLAHKFKQIGQSLLEGLLSNEEEIDSQSDDMARSRLSTSKRVYNYA